MIFFVLERCIRSKNSNFDKNLIKIGYFFFDKMNGVYASSGNKILLKPSCIYININIYTYLVNLG